MEKSLSSQPAVTVCMPAYNEADNISSVINDIRNQNYAGEITIVVCDNASQDNTGEIAASLGAKVVREEQKGTRFAYDTAMRQATTEFILCTNADTRLPPNWIARIVETYQKHPEVVAVGTKLRFYEAPEWINWFLRFTQLINPIPAMWGPSLSVRREIFYKVGGFNHGVNLNEDGIFSLKVKKFGKMRILTDVVVLMDGRRFNRGFFSAIWEWLKGFGFNSILIQLRYFLTGEVKGVKSDFGDIRKNEQK